MKPHLEKRYNFHIGYWYTSPAVLEKMFCGGEHLERVIHDHFPPLLPSGTGKISKEAV